MLSFLKLIRRKLYMAIARPIAKRLPYSDRGDRWFYWHHFFTQHDRWPGKRMLFNDVLYRIKSGPEIVSPLRLKTTDKELAKEFIAERAGAKYNVPTIAVLRNKEDIDKFDFPEECVIKPTHGCGGVTILQGGAQPDRAALAEQLISNYYYAARERNYRDLTGKLIVEPLLFQGHDVHDFKVFCWKGKARCILYVNDRNVAFYRQLYDTNWSLLPIELSPYGIDKPTVDRPLVLQEMLEVAEKLSAPFDFVRIDFYIDDKTLLVGEITHCHWGANDRFLSLDDEKALSRLIFDET